jgi:chemotaxis protein methyltransferase WspC
MFQRQIEALIKAESGIDVAIVGVALIASAVKRQMQLRQLTAVAEYWQVLQCDPMAVQQLIEAIVVSETWFFRDQTPFQFLLTSVQSLLASRDAHYPVRILSLPCSTGEEPYSIAMALLQAGIPAARFQIDAIDISAHNIQQAVAACYPRFSFRHQDAGFDQQLKAQFFQPVGDRYALLSSVKQTVQFRVGNILQPQTCKLGQSYDVIFCRNLLIYFDQPSRQQVLAQIEQWLRSTGILFVGHAESSLLLNAGWQALRVPFTFAYHKPLVAQSARSVPSVRSMPSVRSGIAAPAVKSVMSNPAKLSRAQSKLPSIAPLNTNATQRAKVSLNLSSTIHRAIDPVDDPLLEQLDPLIMATQLLDRGELEAAKLICTQYLRQEPLAAAGYLLLGQIHQIQDQDAMAATCFGKTLYLQPDCLEALIYLADLKHKQGDRLAATRFNERIARLQQRRKG